MARRRISPVLLLVAVTAIWDYTFVPVQEAIAVYRSSASCCSASVLV